MSTMIRYPYDPVGDNPVCKVVGERYALSSINNTYRCIVPEFAPFYREGLIIKSWPSGQTLTEGKHYELGLRYSQENEIATKPLFGAIRFMDTALNGEIELVQYQTVGANFTRGGKKTLEYLVNYLLDPAHVVWESVIQKLDEYPVFEHGQDWHDFTNKETIATAIDGITAAEVAHADKVKSESINVLNARITALDALLTSTKFDQHIISKANPHKAGFADVDALAKNGISVDALKLYAMSLKELADHINSQGITQVDLDKYLAKTDDAVISKRLILKDGAAKIVNGKSTAEIDLASGDIKYLFKGSGNIGGDRARNHPGDTAKWQAGKNILRTASEGEAFSKDSLFYNDQIVIHLGNIRKHLSTINFGTVYVTTGSTDTAAMRGDGRKENPLRVDVKFPTATDTVKGIGIVATTYGQSTTAFIAAKLLAALVRDLTGYVPVTRRVGNHGLDADVVITRDEVGLDVVNNTSDLEKPVSAQQQEVLDEYANTTHSHTAQELSLPIATDAVYGIAYRYSTDIGTEHGTVTPSTLKRIIDAMAERAKIINDALEMDALPVISLTNTATVAPKNVTPPVGAPESEVWSAIIGPGHLLYMNRNVYAGEETLVSLRDVVPTGPLADRTYYVYARAGELNKIKYVVSAEWLATSDSQLFAGTIKTNATGVIPGRLGEYQSFGMFRELLDHINDPQAHMHGSNIKEDFDLGLVENYPMAHVVQPMSAWAITNMWREAIPDALSAGWFKGIDSKTNSVLVNTTGLTLNGSAGWPLLCDDINMWDHLGSDTTPPSWLGDRSGYLESSVEITGLWSGKSLNSSVDAAINWLDVIIGTSKEVSGRNVQLNCRGKLYSELAGQNLAKVELWDVRANDVTQLMQNAGIDPMQIRGTLEEMGGKTPLRISVRWSEHKTTKRRSIYISIELGEFRDVADVTTLSISLDDMEGNADRIAAFNSGKIGFAVRNHAIGSFSITPKLLVDKKQYASANMLIEALARGSGVVSLSGQTTGNYIPMPRGCTRALVMASVADWVGDPGYLMSNMNNWVWYRSGNSNTGDPASPVVFPGTDAMWQQLSGKVWSINGTTEKFQEGIKYNYLVIGFVDVVQAKIID